MLRNESKIALQPIDARYEAKDPLIGRYFIICVEQEKIWYGLD
jgi:hypothetical protein